MVQTNPLAARIRPMVSGDIDEVFALELETFTDSWPRDAFTQWLGEDWAANLVAIDGNTLVGYICAVEQDDELHIHNIAVRRSYHGRGIGRSLLNQAESWGRDKRKLCAILDVRKSNTAAISFYKTLGYEMIGHRKGYYDDPVEDALVFMKVLQEDVAKFM
jgi:ribosomal-protein-alanine N-acetyltransferase